MSGLVASSGPLAFRYNTDLQKHMLRPCPHSGQRAERLTSTPAHARALHFLAQVSTDSPPVVANRSEMDRGTLFNETRNLARSYAAV
jgi:hypothetical protein